MKIVVSNSGWNNVGNGWFAFSAYFMLKKMFPQHKVVLGEDAIDVNFRIYNKKQRANALHWYEHQIGDLNILTGPIIEQLDSIRGFRNLIQNIYRRGGQYAIISGSGTGLSKSRIKEIGAFLKEYPPLFFTSRDEESFNAFSPYIKNSYNGICCAFLVDMNMDIQTYQLDKPFFISSFYTELEPTYRLKDGDKCTIENLIVEHHRTKFGLPYKYSRHLNFLQPQQESVGDLKIVRTIQNLNTRFNHINFAMPNSFISFNPLTYLELAKSAEFTVSDRVHACAISLACGKPARFLFNTPRAGIFTRLGWDYKANNGVMYPKLDLIAEEREKLMLFIKQFIN